jgi:hypothetical protein
MHKQSRTAIANSVFSRAELSEGRSERDAQDRLACEFIGAYLRESILCLRHDRETTAGFSDEGRAARYITVHAVHGH